MGRRAPDFTLQGTSGAADLVLAAGLAAIGAAILAHANVPSVGLRHPAATRSRTLRGVFIYGTAYAVAPISCVLPIFLVALGTNAGTPTDRASGFLGFTLGMASVITIVSLTASLVDDAATRLKALTHFVAPLSGLLMLAAAAYSHSARSRLRSPPSTNPNPAPTRH